VELNKETIPVAEGTLSASGRVGTAALASTSITVKIARTLPEVEEIRRIWTQWKTHRDSDLDFCLNFVWTDPNFLHPHVVVIFRNGVPDALLVGRIEKARIAVKIGYLRLFQAPVRQLTIAYGGVLGNNSTENCELFVKSVSDSLRKGEADVAFFHQADTSSPIYPVALQKPGFFCRDRISKPFPHSFMQFPGTVEQMYLDFSGGLRAEVRKKKKKFLQEFGEKVKTECISHSADLPRVLPMIEEVAKKTYQRGLGVGFELNDYVRTKFEFCANQGWLRIYMLTIGGQPVAFWIGTLYKNIFCSDYHGYDPQYRDYTIGTYIMVETMEDLCAAHQKAIDFGMGEGIYKDRFGNQKTTECSVYIFAPSVKGIALNVIRSAGGSLDSAIRRALEKTNLIPKIKRIWRNKAAKKSAAE
jgi:Acetyltransferase (GNAT) domain